MDLVDGKVGPVKYELDLVAGKLVVKVSAGVEGVSAGLVVELEAGVFLDKLKALIPGQIDDAVIEMLKVALKA